MRPRLVLFDIDGTLLSLRGLGRRSLDRAFEERFSRPALSEGIGFAGRTDPEIVREVLVRAGGDPEGWPDLVSAYLGHLQAGLHIEPAFVLPGVAAALDALATDPSCVCGLVTGNVRRGAEIKLKSVGLWDRFPVGGFGDEAPSRTHLVRLARERAESATGRRFEDGAVFHVGDTVNDVNAAREAGAVAVAVASGPVSRDDLHAAGPHHLLDALDPLESFMKAVAS